MRSHVEVAAGLIEAEARDEIKNAASLEDKLKAAFAVARDHWMFTDVDTQFRGGIGAVLIQLQTGGEDYERLIESLNSMKALNAALSGVPVDFESVALPKNPVDLIGLWKGK